MKIVWKSLMIFACGAADCQPHCWQTAGRLFDQRSQVAAGWCYNRDLNSSWWSPASQSWFYEFPPDFDLLFHKVSALSEAFHISVQVGRWRLQFRASWNMNKGKNNATKGSNIFPPFFELYRLYNFPSNCSGLTSVEFLAKFTTRPCQLR